MKLYMLIVNIMWVAWGLFCLGTSLWEQDAGKAWLNGSCAVIAFVNLLGWIWIRRKP